MDNNIDFIARRFGINLIGVNIAELKDFNRKTKIIQMEMFNAPRMESCTNHDFCMCHVFV